MANVVIGAVDPERRIIVDSWERWARVDLRLDAEECGACSEE